ETFSLTSTLPRQTQAACVQSSWQDGGEVDWRCKVIADNMLRRCGPPPIPCFRWRCGGAVAGPLHWRAGWQTGSLARPIALNAYFCQENCPLVNYPNETMSSLPLIAHYAPAPPLTTHSSSFMSVDGGTSRRRWEVSRGRSRPAAK